MVFRGSFSLNLHSCSPSTTTSVTPVGWIEQLSSCLAIRVVAVAKMSLVRPGTACTRYWQSFFAQGELYSFQLPTPADLLDARDWTIGSTTVE
jgi:hypothetical protein